MNDQWSGNTLFERFLRVNFVPPTRSSVQRSSRRVITTHLGPPDLGGGAGRPGAGPLPPHAASRTPQHGPRRSLRRGRPYAHITTPASCWSARSSPSRYVAVPTGGGRGFSAKPNRAHRREGGDEQCDHRAAAARRAVQAETNASHRHERRPQQVQTCSSSCTAGRRTAGVEQRRRVPHEQPSRDLRGRRPAPAGATTRREGRAPSEAVAAADREAAGRPPSSGAATEIRITCLHHVSGRSDRSATAVQRRDEGRMAGARRCRRRTYARPSADPIGCRRAQDRRRRKATNDPPRELDGEEEAVCSSTGPPHRRPRAPLDGLHRMGPHGMRPVSVHSCGLGRMRQNGPHRRAVRDQRDEAGPRTTNQHEAQPSRFTSPDQAEENTVRPEPASVCRLVVRAGRAVGVRPADPQPDQPPRARKQHRDGVHRPDRRIRAPSRQAGTSPASACEVDDSRWRCPPKRREPQHRPRRRRRERAPLVHRHGAPRGRATRKHEDPHRGRRSASTGEKQRHRLVPVGGRTSRGAALESARRALISSPATRFAGRGGR